MNNMRYYLLAALSICSLSGAHAQSGVKYPYVEDGAPIIVSHDEGGGISELALLTKVQIEDLNKIAGNYLVDDVHNRVSPRFQVAQDNCSSYNAPGVAVLTGSSTYNGNNTMDACKVYKEGDIPQGSWRTPTQKELLLIWVLREQLKPNLQTEAFNTTSVVATRIGMTYNTLYYVKKETDSSMKSGDVTAWYKDGFYVRCVRDL